MLKSKKPETPFSRFYDNRNQADVARYQVLAELRKTNELYRQFRLAGHRDVKKGRVLRVVNIVQKNNTHNNDIIISISSYNIEIKGIYGEKIVYKFEETDIKGITIAHFITSTNTHVQRLLGNTITLFLIPNSRLSQ